MIYYFKPFSLTKNLGECYNQYMALIGDDDTAVLLDGDTCFLTPDYGMVIAEYIAAYPDAVLTCWTNRINEKAEQQYKDDPQWLLEAGYTSRETALMTHHLNIATDIQKHPMSATALHGFVSGFMLVVPKRVWNVTKFPEKQMFEDRGPHNLLGCDNWFTNEVRKSGVPILRMNRIYLWHTYRLLQGDHDKKHLL